MSIRLTLPYPPSANNYWRANRGRVHKSTQAKKYIDNVKWITKRQNLTPIEGHVQVQIEVYRPARRGDLDNTLKVLLDALNGLAYADDSQITQIFAKRFEDKANPRVEIMVTRIA
jgi:crossover junction endodeoxyribonuclease RusA